MEKKYNVGGVLLDRPFKIRRLGLDSRSDVETPQ